MKRRNAQDNYRLRFFNAKASQEVQQGFSNLKAARNYARSNAGGWTRAEVTHYAQRWIYDLTNPVKRTVP